MQAPATVKKSKPGKVIASRYQQSALQKAAPRNNILITSNVSKSSGSSNESTCLDSTVAAWGKTPTGRKGNNFMSTPAVSHVAAPMCDASAISVDQSCLPILMESLDESVITKKPGNRSTKSDVAAVPVLTLPKIRKKQKNDGLLEAEVNLHSARCLQAMFLQSKAKKAFLARTEETMADLHKLWMADRMLMKQNQVLEQEHNCIQYVMQMTDFCKEKAEMYEPITPHLADTLSQYKQLCDTVDSMKRALSVPNVTFTTATFTRGNLQTAAKECAQLYSMFETFSSEQRDLPKVADLLEKVRLLQVEIDDVQTQCLKLLSTVDSLVLEETSLKISNICLKGM